MHNPVVQFSERYLIWVKFKTIRFQTQSDIC